MSDTSNGPAKFTHYGRTQIYMVLEVHRNSVSQVCNGGPGSALHQCLLFFFFFFSPFIYCTSSREQDEAYINSQ